MFYFDTSFLVPLILPEETSDRIADFVRGLAVDKLMISHWARVEFSSLLARDVRTGVLEAQAAAEGDAQFENMARESFVVALPNADDFTLAKAFLGDHESGLRAGDALHLAIASNRRAEAIYSLDRTMIRAGRTLGLPVSTGIRLASYGD